MRFVPRILGRTVMEAARSFPAVVLTGPRRAGKTTLLRRLFPRARYVLLEDPDVQARARADPRGLLDELSPPVLFDEIQNVPELLAYVRTLIDQKPRLTGQWLFTGSQEAPLMKGVSESMAGRAAILQLLPMSLGESNKVSMLAGGFPEALARPKVRGLWFSSYVQSYLERDVRRFLGLLASRHGQVLNRTDLAAPLGVSVPTISDWLHILEVTGQILLVLPYFENFGKRLTKSPKLYLLDSGLACHLLGVNSASELERSPFRGALFEGFVAGEILKSQVNAGRRKELYYFRDQQGLEVDFLFPGRNGELWMIESKASKTVQPAMAKPLLSLRKATPQRTVKLLLVHSHSENGPATQALAPQVKAMDIGQFSRLLNAR